MGIKVGKRGSKKAVSGLTVEALLKLTGKDKPRALHELQKRSKQLSKP